MRAAVAARRCRWPSRCRASRDVTLRGRGVISARPVCTAFRANATVTHGCGQTCKKKRRKKRESATANVCVNAIYRSDATSLSTTLTFVFRVQFKVVTKCSGSTPVSCESTHCSVAFETAPVLVFRGSTHKFHLRVRTVLAVLMPPPMNLL